MPLEDGEVKVGLLCDVVGCITYPTQKTIVIQVVCYLYREKTD